MHNFYEQHRNIIMYKQIFLLWTLLFCMQTSAWAEDPYWDIVDSAKAAYARSDYEGSILLNERGLAITPPDSVYVLVELYSNQLVAYYRLGDLDRALEYGEQALRIDEQYGDKIDLSLSLGNLAGIYTTAGKHDVAECYLLRAIGLELELLSEDAEYTRAHLAVRKGMLSEVYCAMALTEKDAERRAQLLQTALLVAGEALTYDRELGSEQKLGTRLAQVGYAHMLLGDYAQAEQYSQDAIRQCRAVGNKVSEALTLRQLGQVYLRLAEARPAERVAYEAKADEALRQSLALAKEIGYLKVEAEVYQELYVLEARRMRRAAGRAVPVLDYAEQRSLLNDSLRRRDLDQKLTMWQVRYNLREKEQQMMIQELELQASHRRQIFLLAFLIVCLVAIAAIVVALVLSYRHRRTILTLAEQKDRHYRILSHDLKNPMVAQQQLLRLLDDQYETMSDEDRRMCVRKVIVGTDMQLQLLANLQEISLLEMGKRRVTVDKVDLSGILNDVVPMVKPVADLKDIRLCVAPERVLVRVDREMARTIVRNIIMNALKFSQPDSSIDIRVTPEGTIVVADHGVGMTEQQYAAVADREEKVMRSTSGTNGEKGSGVGLMICKSLMRLNGGHLSARPTEGGGTTFELHFSQS